jgi:hypothetical protein
MFSWRGLQRGVLSVCAVINSAREASRLIVGHIESVTDQRDFLTPLWRTRKRHFSVDCHKAFTDYR